MFNYISSFYNYFRIFTNIGLLTFIFKIFFDTCIEKANITSKTGKKKQTIKARIGIAISYLVLCTILYFSLTFRVVLTLISLIGIGTLFAFVLVCGGVLLIPRKERQLNKFHLPYINGQFIFPLIVVVAILSAKVLNANYFSGMINFDFSQNPEYTSGKFSFMDLATPNITLIIFWLTAVVLSFITFFKKYSLIPLMGLITCLYLLTGMTKSNWAWFLAWLAIGLVIYLLYGYKKSKLAD